MRFSVVESFPVDRYVGGVTNAVVVTAVEPVVTAVTDGSSHVDDDEDAVVVGTDALAFLLYVCFGGDENVSLIGGRIGPAVVTGFGHTFGFCVVGMTGKPEALLTPVDECLGSVCLAGFIICTFFAIIAERNK